MKLKLRNVRKSFEERVVLAGINLEVNAGEVVSFIGSSGSGKQHCCVVSTCSNQLTMARFFSTAMRFQALVVTQTLFAEESALCFKVSIYFHT